MANRRMFAITIVQSDHFLDMPLSTQALYFHLGMMADDDGFVTPKKTMRMIGATDDELSILLAKRFVIKFKTGVILITHWKENNWIQKDRYKKTVFVDELKTVSVSDNKTYSVLDTECIQDVSSLDTQVRLGKLSIGKDSIEYSSLSPSAPERKSKRNSYPDDFEEWWKHYPRREGKGGAFKAWKKKKTIMPPIQDHIEIINKWSKSEQWKDSGGQYVPSPSKWINEMRWDDDIPKIEESSMDEVRRILKERKEKNDF